MNHGVYAQASPQNPNTYEDEAPLLARRNDVSTKLEEDPYGAPLYLARCEVYNRLRYPDLSAMDAYKVLLIVDELTDESSEFHEEAYASACSHLASLPLEIRRKHVEDNETARACLVDGKNPPVEEDEVQAWAQNVLARQAYTRLANALAQCGCLRDAYDFLQQGLRAFPDDVTVLSELQTLQDMAAQHFAARHEPWPTPVSGTASPSTISPSDVQRLPSAGLVRRELYPWNTHEADRSSPAVLLQINEQLSQVAPKLEARLTELPALSIPDAAHAHTTDSSTTTSPSPTTVTQLGLFAREDIAAGERSVLRERSILAVNARLHEDMCDACSAPLPGVAAGGVQCEECDEAVFCSARCHDLAQRLYHGATCGGDYDTLARGEDVAPAEAADALYTLLLLRAMAMARAQDVHLLDLPELAFIWGDFTNAGGAHGARRGGDAAAGDEPPRTLPFSFKHNILLPLTALSHLTPATSALAAPHGLAEGWAYNTVLAKLRGTASARLSARDGRPEVAAVHALWCLANHSCDPNVAWEWAGEVEFWARARRVAWVGGEGGKGEREGGLRAGDEVLNHYVDIDLPVKERREWGRGALGGDCMCERCVEEAAADGMQAGGQHGKGDGA